MIINGQEVPESHIQAGIAVMTGRFTRKAIADAVRAAGSAHARYLADKLIRREQSRGLIVRCDGGKWARVDRGYIIERKDRNEWVVVDEWAIVPTSALKMFGIDHASTPDQTVKHIDTHDENGGLRFEGV